jgi:hypothetical protein
MIYKIICTVIILLIIFVISFIGYINYINRLFNNKKTYNAKNYDDEYISKFNNDNTFINEISEFKRVYSNIPDKLQHDEINICRSSVYIDLMDWKNEEDDFQKHPFKNLY